MSRPGTSRPAPSARARRLHERGRGMSGEGAAAARRLDGATVPRFAPHVRLQFSEARGQWIVQAPERVLMPDEIAVAVLRKCDGSASIAAIAEALAAEYAAPRG